MTLYNYKVDYSEHFRKYYVSMRPIYVNSRASGGAPFFDTAKEATTYIETLRAKHVAAHNSKDDDRRMVIETVKMIIRHRFKDDIHMGLMYRACGEEFTKLAVQEMCQAGEMEKINKLRYRLT